MCSNCSAIGAAAQHADIDAFAERLLQSLNASAVVAMLSVGHRTGLFDAMEDGAWLTSQSLADRAGLNERYVREWLGAMTCSQIVQHDAGKLMYRLPTEHASLLTRAAAPNNLAAPMQWLGVLGAIEDDVVDAFTHGRGVPYERYNRFQEVMAEESGQTVVAALDEHILPLAPGLADRLHDGIDALDVGCGRGMALLRLAEQFPNSRFTGIDLLREHVEWAQEEAERRGLSNVRFRTLDAALLDERDAYDFIATFDAVHDQGDPAAVLANIRQALRPGGAYLCQEIKAETAHADNADHPLGTFIYTISTFHCMSVSLAAGGAGLGAAWGRTQCRAMLESAGFERIEMHELDHDPQNDFWVCG